MGSATARAVCQIDGDLCKGTEIGVACTVDGNDNLKFDLFPRSGIDLLVVKNVVEWLVEPGDEVRPLVNPKRVVFAVYPEIEFQIVNIVEITVEQQMIVDVAMHFHLGDDGEQPLG